MADSLSWSPENCALPTPPRQTKGPLNENQPYLTYPLSLFPFSGATAHILCIASGITLLLMEIYSLCSHYLTWMSLFLLSFAWMDLFCFLLNVLGGTEFVTGNYRHYWGLPLFKNICIAIEWMLRCSIILTAWYFLKPRRNWLSFFA